MDDEPSTLHTYAGNIVQDESPLAKENKLVEEPSQSLDAFSFFVQRLYDAVSILNVPSIICILLLAACIRKLLSPVLAHDGLRKEAYR